MGASHKNEVCCKPEVVGHFKHSILAMTALKGKQAQLGIKEQHLLQDVATRWNSTCFMMERLCEQRVATN